jgi:hypothetical protein
MAAVVQNASGEGQGVTTCSRHLFGLIFSHLVIDDLSVCLQGLLPDELDIALVSLEVLHRSCIVDQLWGSIETVL